MDPRQPQVDVDALLAHRDSVLRLARHLVGDSDRAEDVAQEAMVVGLGSGGRARSGLGAWLAGVTRHLVAREYRGGARRSTRERAAARHEALPATEDLVIRAAEHRRVLAALEALDEPSRTTLLLRYFEDLPPRRIAARLGLPVATIKSRLYRGLERLRAQLDDEHGGDRRAWVSALAPTALMGGLAVGTKITLSVAAALVLSLGLWWLTADTHEDVVAPVSTGDVEGALELEAERAGLVALDTPSAVSDTEPTPGPVRVPATYTGRVVDAARFPVDDADVRILRDGRPLATVHTGPDGRYQLDAALVVPDTGVYGWLAVQARTRDGRVGYGFASWTLATARAGGHEIWPIVVDTGHTTDVLVEAGGLPVEGAEVLTRVRPTPGTRWFVANRLLTDREGRARLEVPAGAVGLLVRAAGHASAIDGFESPRTSDETLRIALGREGTFTAGVREEGSGEPASGVEIQVSALVSGKGEGAGWRLDEIGVVYTTDASGDVRIPTFAEGTSIYVSAFARDRPRTQWGGQPWVEVTGDVVDLTVPAHTALRWPIDPSGDNPPPDGTVVSTHDARTSADSGGVMVPARAVVEDGHLVLRDAAAGPWVDYQVLAVLDDGRSALLRMPKGETLGPEIAFEPGREIRVRVVHADGRPVKGIYVHVREGQPQELRRHLSVRTDEDGRGVLRPLLPLVTKLHAHGQPETFGDVGASVDVESGDADVELVLPGPKRVTLTVEIDGKRGLPRAYDVWLGEGPPTGKQLSPLVLEENPARGEVAFEVHTDVDLEAEEGVWIRARGYPAARGTLMPTGEGRFTAAVSLDARGMLDVRIHEPADKRVRLALERWAPEYKDWYRHDRRGATTKGADGTWRMGPLGAGRYRAVDTLTGIVSAPVDIEPSRGSQRVELDLSRAGDVTGKVVVPTGTDMNHVRVVVEGVTGNQPPTPPPGDFEFREPGGAVKPALDGTFTVRVPGDRPVTLTPWHPRLRATASETFDGPSGDVGLRLEHGPLVRFAFDVLGAKPYSPFVGRIVKLYVGEVEGDPVFIGRPMQHEGILEFGGFAPGTYTVWVDGVTRAPWVKKGVVLGEGTTVLEGVAFGIGSSLRVTFLLPEGKTKPMVRLRAQHVEAPDMIRSTFVTGETDEWVLEGLTAGRWSFMVRRLSGGAAIVYEEEIEVDGSTDVAVTVDLR